MKIDLSKNKKSNNGNKKDDPVGKLTGKPAGKPAPKDDGKSPIQKAIEEKVPFIGVLTERFSLKTIAIGAIIILFILIALVGRMFGGGEEEDIDDLDNTPQEEVVDVVETEQPTDEETSEDGSEEVSEETEEVEEVSEVVMEDVKANLLNPDKDIEDPTNAKNVVLEGLKHLEALASENGMYQPNENQAMGTTDTPIANDIILAMQAGYKVDMENSEWTQGSKDFVYQFVIPIHSDNAPNGFLSGNYRTDTNDFRIVRLEGIDYSAIASPGGGEDFSQGPSEEELKRMEEERANSEE